MGNSFIDFLKKPMMCKCGHPKKPCHRSGKWYDTSNHCKECNCDGFIRRNASSKLNKGLDITAICILGFGSVVLFAGAYAFQSIGNIPGIAAQTLKFNAGDIVNFMYIIFLCAGLYVSLFVFSWIQTYFKVNRKEIKPIDPKWSKENE